MLASSFAFLKRAKLAMGCLRHDRKGITALEYGILAAIMVAALVGSFGTVPSKLTDVFAAIGGKLLL